MEIRFLGGGMHNLVSLHWVKCSLPSGHSDILFSYTQRSSAWLFRARGVIQAYSTGALQAQREDKQPADGSFLTVIVMGGINRNYIMMCMKMLSK